MIPFDSLSPLSIPIPLLYLDDLTVKGNRFMGFNVIRMLARQKTLGIRNLVVGIILIFALEDVISFI